MQKVRVMIKHEVNPELLDILTRVNTAAAMEVIGPEVILYDVDMLELQRDICKVCQQADYINRIEQVAGYPWIAREVLEGRAIIKEGKCVYLQKRHNGPLREKLETIIGPVTDKQFKEILELTTDDIKFNLMGFRETTTIEEVIKIAARCYEALKRCGT